MDLFEAIKRRASVRSFRKCAVPEEDLMRIVDAGRRAPSGHNRQPREFIVITEPEIIASLGELQGCIAEASAAIAVVMDENATPFWREDAAAAVENMLLAITALGYAGLWAEGTVLRSEAHGKAVLQVPDDRRLVAVVPVGQPAGAVAQATKKPMSEVLHRERYGTR